MQRASSLSRVPKSKLRNHEVTAVIVYASNATGSSQPDATTNIATLSYAHEITPANTRNSVGRFFFAFTKGLSQSISSTLFGPKSVQNSSYFVAFSLFSLYQ
jgi:hypothetical protein